MSLSKSDLIERYTTDPTSDQMIDASVDIVKDLASRIKDVQTTPAVHSAYKQAKQLFRAYVRACGFTETAEFQALFSEIVKEMSPELWELVEAGKMIKDVQQKKRVRRSLWRI